MKKKLEIYEHVTSSYDAGIKILKYFSIVHVNSYILKYDVKLIAYFFEYCALKRITNYA